MVVSVGNVIDCRHVPQTANCVFGGVREPGPRGQPNLSRRRFLRLRLKLLCLFLPLVALLYLYPLPGVFCVFARAACACQVWSTWRRSYARRRGVRVSY